MRSLTIAALSILILLCEPPSRILRVVGCIQSAGLLSLPTCYGLGATSCCKPPLVNAARRSAQESISLEPSKPVERELSGGQSHSYKITLTSGQYLRIVV